MGGAVATTPTGPVVGSQKVLSKANVRPLFFCGIALFGAFLYGYDGTYFTGILEMERFKNEFGTPQPDGTVNLSSGIRSAMASVVQAGEFLGSLSAGPIGNYFGRKGVFWAVCFFITLGIVLQVIVEGSIPLLGLGRGILGIGVGQVANAAPLYLSEVSPTAIRAAVVGSWQLLLAIGQVVGAGVGQGTKDITTSWSWRTPILVNLVIVVLIAGGMFVIPESPRWLVSKGRDERALAALRRINKGQDDPDAVVHLEFGTFRQAREDELAMSGKGGVRALTKGVELRKLGLVAGILVTQQISGIQVVFSYATVIFATINLNDPFLATLILTLVEVAGVLVSYFIVNRFGRRPLLIWTTVVMFICQIAYASIGTVDVNQRTDSMNKAILALFSIYTAFFNFAWGPLAWTVASELCPGFNRNLIMSLGVSCFWLAAFVVTFTLPYLYDETEAGLELLVGYIYAGGSAIALAFVFFCLPETKGRTLEEISLMLQARLPARAWSKYAPGTFAASHMDDETAAGSSDTAENQSATGESDKDAKTAKNKDDGDAINVNASVHDA